MRGRAILASSISAFLVCGLFVSAQAAQDKTTASVPPGSPERMMGQWRLNRELSTLMPEAEVGAQGGGRRGPGGGGMGGRGGGGRSYGGGGGGGREGGGNTEDALKFRALSNDLADVATTLTVIVAPTHVTITNDRGTVRKFTTDGAIQEIDLVTAKVTAKTTWDRDILTQEWAAGKTKVRTTYQVTVQGHMLVVRIAPAASGNAVDPTPIAKYIFDRVE